jgi:serine protease inhibitor
MGMGTAFRVTAGLAAAALLAAGCGSAPAARRQPAGVVVTRGLAVREPAADPRPVGAADAAFGLDLLGAWCRHDPRSNIVFSPESLASGLGLAYLGARGGTARAIAHVLHLPAAGQALLADLQARSAALGALDGPGVTVSGSDQVWADSSMTTRRSYLNEVATGYDADVRQVPLQSDPSQAARQIDAVIDRATRGHIPKLLSPADVSGTGWVLTDALYLNADWATPFQAARTSSGQFTTAAGQQVSARFLNGGSYRFARAGGWTAVSLPYQGGKLSMTALLPDSRAGGCPALPAATLAKISKGLARPAGGRTPGGAGGVVSGQAGISLPKVSLSSKEKLNGLLTGLGMGIAFGSDADFAGLSPQACCIGTVIHAATLQLGEKGTVASAATAVGILPSAVPFEPRIVTFDRPFVLLVTDPATGEPLFLARVADASGS